MSENQKAARRLILCGLLLLALVCPPRVFAWNDLGHMLVAKIAHDRLKPKAKARAEQLLAINTDSTSVLNRTCTFVTAACWADDIKRQRKTAPWHYIDIPYSLDGTMLQIFEPPQMDIVRAINQCKAALMDAHVDQRKKNEALKYLIHLVGDIHQPLHCTTLVTAQRPHGDKGGNDFQIAGLGAYRNLHAFWDGGAGLFSLPPRRPLNAEGQQHLEDLARKIAKQTPYSARLVAARETSTWAQESFKLAKAVTYQNIKVGEAPSAAYTARAQAAIERQIAKAGYRLADLLNRLLES